MSSKQYFLTGDTHFSHANVVQYCNRPFGKPFELTEEMFATNDEYYNALRIHRQAVAAEMNEELIEQWNSTVSKHDVVYHVGDIIFDKDAERRQKVLSQLNGEIHFIWGNHDWELKTAGWQKFFKSAADMRTIKLPMPKGGHQRIVLCHYAMRVWDQSHYGTLQFHGHSHGTLPPAKNQLDVGVDNAYKLLGKYRPFTLEEAVSFATSYSANPYNGDCHVDEDK